jgi:hypothetical protein
LEHRLIFREVNLRIRELTAAYVAAGREDEAFGFVCECMNLRCVARVPLTHDEFTAIARTPGHYLVAPGHDDGDDVEVVQREPDYAVNRVGEYARERAEAHWRWPRRPTRRTPLMGAHGRRRPHPS